MSFDNFQQADFREANCMDAENHQKRLEKELREIIRFFEEEDQGVMLHIIQMKKLNVTVIREFIEQT